MKDFEYVVLLGYILSVQNMDPFGFLDPGVPIEDAAGVLASPTGIEQWLLMYHYHTASSTLPGHI
jgi:hypothetical protein